MAAAVSGRGTPARTLPLFNALLEVQAHLLPFLQPLDERIKPSRGGKVGALHSKGGGRGKRLTISGTTSLRQQLTQNFWLNFSRAMSVS